METLNMQDVAIHIAILIVAMKRKMWLYRVHAMYITSIATLLSFHKLPQGSYSMEILRFYCILGKI